jgi:hypothetical protein
MWDGKLMENYEGIKDHAFGMGNPLPLNFHGTVHVYAT